MVDRLNQALPRVKRDLTLDILRGYFLFVIIIDHLGSFPSLFEPLTGGGMLLVSAAEGFFFLSGLLVGRLRGNDVRHGHMAKANRWLLHRAAVLYSISVVLTLSFTLVARSLNYFPRVTLGVSHAGWLETILRTITFQYSFGLADMLPLYAVYMLISIGALYWLAKGKWRAVLVVSFIVWALSLALAAPFRPIGTYFSATSWQLLFFGGLVLGYHNQAVQDWWTGLGRRLRLQILSLVATVAVAGIALSWALRLVRGLYDNYKFFLEPSFDTIKLGPGRVLLFAACIVVAYHGVKHFEATINRWVGWFFVPLGQHSLFVYTLHSLLVFGFIGHPVKQFWPATFLGLGMVTLIYGITLLYSKVPSKHKYL